MDSEGKEQPPQPSTAKKGITRRGFLKLGLGVAAGAAATIVAKIYHFHFQIHHLNLKKQKNH